MIFMQIFKFFSCISWIADASDTLMKIEKRDDDYDSSNPISFERIKKTVKCPFSSNEWMQYKDSRTVIPLTPLQKPLKLFRIIQKSPLNNIGKFDRILSLEKIYYKILDRLLVPITRITCFSSNVKNLLINIKSLLTLAEILPSPNDLFWYDLERFLFKCIILIRQETVDDNVEFQNGMSYIKVIANIIHRKSHIKTIFNLDSKNSILPIPFHNYGFMELVKMEFFEFHHQLFSLFVSIVNSFYNENKGNEWSGRREKEMTDKDSKCETLKSVYFNGNYDKNLLLKFLIILHDPRGEMRKCIMNDDYQLHILKHFIPPPVDINLEYLVQLPSKGPPNLEIYSMERINASIINFYLENDQKFQIEDFHSLFNLLKRLKEFGLLKKRIIRKIIDFPHSECTGWDGRIFKKYLQDYKNFINCQSFLEGEVEEGERMESGKLKENCLECDEYLKIVESTKSHRSIKRMPEIDEDDEDHYSRPLHTSASTGNLKKILIESRLKNAESSISLPFNKSKITIKSKFKIFRSSAIFIENEGDHELNFKSFNKSILLNQSCMNESTMHLHEKVIQQLNSFQPKELKLKLDFDNENFASKLLDSLISILKREGKEGINHKFIFFWHDITRLVFKWAIHMKQKVSDNNSRFREITASIKMISLISIEISNLDLSINFNSKHEKIVDSGFVELITLEVYENSSKILPFFTSAIEYFYPKKGIWNRRWEFGKKNEKLDPCENFKLKYFGSSYENNILLKFLILFYSPFEKMRDCIIEEDRYASYLKPFARSLKVINSDYIDKIKFKGPDKLKITDMGYVNRNIIEFFLRTNQRFHMNSHVDLIQLLKRLKEARLLKKEVLKKIIGFKLPLKEYLEWDEEEFKKYIMEYKKSCSSNLNEQAECNEYLKLIEKPNIVSELSQLFLD